MLTKLCISFRDTGDIFKKSYSCERWAEIVINNFGDIYMCYEEKIVQIFLGYQYTLLHFCTTKLDISFWIVLTLFAVSFEEYILHL